MKPGLASLWPRPCRGQAEAACCLVRDAEGLGPGEAQPRLGGGRCHLCKGRACGDGRKPHSWCVPEDKGLRKALHNDEVSVLSYQRRMPWGQLRGGGLWGSATFLMFIRHPSNGPATRQREDWCPRPVEETTRSRTRGGPEKGGSWQQGVPNPGSRWFHRERSRSGNPQTE